MLDSAAGPPFILFIYFLGARRDFGLFSLPLAAFTHQQAWGRQYAPLGLPRAPGTPQQAAASGTAHSERGRGKTQISCAVASKGRLQEAGQQVINSQPVTKPPRAQVPSPSEEAAASCWTPATHGEWRRAPRIARGPARASHTQSQHWGLRGGAATCWPQGEGFWVEQEALVAPSGAGCGLHGGHAKDSAFQLLSPGLLRSRAWVLTALHLLGPAEGQSSPRCTQCVGQRGSSPHPSAARARVGKRPRAAGAPQAAVVENS